MEGLQLANEGTVFGTTRAFLGSQQPAESLQEVLQRRTPLSLPILQRKKLQPYSQQTGGGGAWLRGAVSAESLGQECSSPSTMPGWER